MTLTTDDLRDALAEAADDPYLSRGGARLDDVRARVRTIRRRATAAAAASGIAVVAVAVSGVLGHGSSMVSPAPAISPRPSVTTAPAMPALWGVRDVVGQVTGSGWQTPSTSLSWPSGTTGVLVHCTGTDRAVQVDVRPAAGVASRTSVPCQGTAGAWQEADLPTAATSIAAGTDVTVQAQLDDPAAATTFSVALLVGKNHIDLSTLAVPPEGYEDLGGFALTDGWFYSGVTSDGEPAATADPAGQNGAQLVLGDRRAVHLTVHCFGATVLEVTGEEVDGPAAVTCPADVRAVKELDVPLRRGDEQRLALRIRDSAPGALVEVGVSARRAG
jgi:hypothetical protein